MRQQIHWGGREEAQFYKIGISLPVWSQLGYELQLLQIKKLSWKASRNEEDCRVLTVKSNRKISGKPERFR
ncbi:TPA: hypothetical protein NY293_004004 [Escherichia coli]|uniref:Uncharacterized protein n=1 Tax=Escherichia coli TaxID=562 RepID=A0A827ENR4_ECOLX|nr:hypothetical protein [Escherichia coli]EFE9629224.1 hypothetical protein [Escherichia coli]EFM6347108.1 hypothetical protein [Escherichia coli]EFM7190746.1 hypothetical protein [Escherichia coli]EFM7569236.1 hypothetical protein [Escherichia coli]